MVTLYPLHNTIGGTDVATNIFKVTTIILALGFLISGCTTSTYTFKGQPKSLANGTIEFEEPQVTRKLNWLGYIGMAIGAGAGGVAGYHSNISIDGEIKPTTNAVYGGVAGGLITAGAILLSNDQPPLGPATTGIWLQHIDSNLRLVSSKMGDSNRVKAIVAVRSDIDSNFRIQTMEDAELFSRMFPESPHKNHVIEIASWNIDRDKLPELIVMFPDQAGIIKKVYAQRSPSITECMNAITLYPEVRETAMKRAHMLLSNLHDFIDALNALNKYPVLQEKGLDQLALMTDDRLAYRLFLKNFPTTKFTSEFQTKLVNSSDEWLKDARSVEGLKERIVECAEIVKENPNIAGQIDDIITPWVISNQLYDLYFKYFPEGRSTSKIIAHKDSVSKTIQAQVDQDLPVFKTVVSEFHRHVSRLASGVRSAAGDATRLISSNEDLYYRLQKAEPYMSSSQKSTYQTYMDEWEQTASWLQRISP